MKRAKLRGLKRNAAVVLGNVGNAEDSEILTAALQDAEPLVREHAAWALARLGELIAGQRAAGAGTAAGAADGPSANVGVDRSTAISSSVMSIGTSANNGVVR